MKRLTLKEQGALSYVISATNKPRMQIEPGETIMVETEDAFSGQIRKEGDLRDLASIPYGNPQTGPIYVNGAESGDTLAVKIEDIKPLIGQGATRIVSSWYTSRPDSELFARFLDVPPPPHGARICRIRDGLVRLDRFAVPYRPMIGTLSTAHPDETFLAWFPGPHGGNMDIPEVTNGATVYLPVRAKGALLYIGDAHAVQGNGELSGAAVEMPALTTITVNLIKRSVLSWPRLENNSDIFAISCTETGRSFEDAMRVAFTELTLWLEKDYSIERWLAFELLTMVSKISIGNFWTLAVGIEKKYLKNRG